MSATINAAEYSELERAVCETLPIDLEHIPDEDTQVYDARVEASMVSSTHSRLFGMIHLGPDTVVEIKTCHRWVSDRHSANGRRRGRWKIDEGRHRDLKDLDGVYLLVVLEEDQIAAWCLTPAGDLDAVLPWTSNGDGEHRDRSAQLRWAEVFDPDHLKEPRP